MHDLLKGQPWYYEVTHLYLDSTAGGSSMFIDTRTESPFFSQQASENLIMLALFVSYLWALEIKLIARCTFMSNGRRGHLNARCTLTLNSVEGLKERHSF
jgi:hypothetical protein